MKVTLNVRQLVDRRGWDAAALARQAGLDPATAASHYAGRSSALDLAQESRISEALGVRPDALRVSVEEPHTPESGRNFAGPRYQRLGDEVPESSVLDDPGAALDRQRERP